ncbi:Uncharacterized protein ToN1_10250 [Aromatoleum petrolei]|nr:Uncharacterized protein ToN1_10250 [Aromatoleum petrolei]
MSQGGREPQEPIIARAEAARATVSGGADYARLSELLGEIRGLQRELATFSRAGTPDPAGGRRALGCIDDSVIACIGRVRETLATLEDARDCRPLLHAVRDLAGGLLDQLQHSLAECDGDCEGAGQSDVAAALRLRLVRAGAERVIWERCSGGPPHPHVWRWLGVAFLHAVRERDPAIESPTLAETGAEASVEFHYVKALAACTASLDVLAPRLLSSVGRLLNQAVPVASFEPAAFKGATHWVAPQEGSGPCRLVGQVEAMAGAWFLSPGFAPEMFREARTRAIGDEQPSAFSSDGRTASLHLQALDHLLRHWSAALPVRRHRRHLIEGVLAAVAGIDELRKVFGGEHGVRREEWRLRDLSRGGVGAIAANGSVSIGQLVGIHPVDGQGWQLALVRRSWARDDDSAHLGLEILSRKPMLAHVDDGRRPADVLLCDPLRRGEAVRVIAPPREFGAPDLPLFVTGNGGVQKLKPLDACYTGEGFELRVYQVL